MKSQIEHINIHSFHLFSEMFTIYLPFHMARKLALNFCYYQSEYNLANCTMPYSKGGGGGRVRLMSEWKGVVRARVMGDGKR